MLCGSGLLVVLAVSVVPGCAPGKYSPGTSGAAAACRLCPAGKYQPTRGARMCLMGCPRGTFKHGITCLPCAAGRFNRGLPPGSVSAQTAGACVLCPRGKHAATDAGGGTVAPHASCTSCAAGQFMAREGEIACEPCAAGRQAAAAGALHCTACSAGHYSREGFARCVACRPGFAASEVGAARCRSCPAGTLAVGAGAAVCKSRCMGGSCRSCPPGKFFKYVGTEGIAGSCRVCSAGRFNSKSGALGCPACPLGKHQPRMHSVFCRACVRCKAGQHVAACGTRQSHSGRCVACPAGRASASGKPCGTGCDADHVMLQSACYSCSADMSLKFSVGHLKAIHGACRRQREHGVRHALSDCTPGKFLHYHAPDDAADAGDVWQCALCPAGQYQNLGSQSTCKKCLRGWHSAYGAKQCAPKGGERPQECPAGRWGRLLDLGAELGGASVHCYDCPPGRFGPKSTYWRSDGKRVRAALLPGSMGAPPSGGTGGAVCFVCPAGKHQKKKGQARCNSDIAAADGTLAPTAAISTRALCPAGRFAGKQGCNMCPSGMYKIKRDLKRCTSCPPGKYQALFGQAQCKACQAGWLQASAGQTLCIKQKGADALLRKQKRAAGQSQLCKRGKFLKRARMQVQAAASAQCMACPRGKFQPAVGRDNCWPCAHGKIAAHRGAVKCLAVPTSAPTPVPTPAPTATPFPTPFPTPRVMVPARACPAGRYTNKMSLNGFQVRQGTAIQCWVCPTGKWSARRRPLYESISSPATLATVVVPAAANAVCETCGVGLLSEPRRLGCVSSCAKGSYAVDIDATARRLMWLNPFARTSDDSAHLGPHFGSYYRHKRGEATIPASGAARKAGLGHFASYYAKKVAPAAGASSKPSAASEWRGHFAAYHAHERSDGWREFRTATSAAATVVSAPGSHSVHINADAFGVPASVVPARGPALPAALSAAEVAADEAAASKELREAIDRATHPNPFGIQPRQLKGCVLCPPGQSQAAGGAKWCENCPSGQFQKSAGAGFCNKCPAGRHQPRAGSAFCEVGGKHTAQATGTGTLSSAFDFLASVFGKGKAGHPVHASAADQPSNPKKPLCPAGRYVSVSDQAWFCAKCPAGKFQPTTGGRHGCHSMHDILFPPTPVPTPVPPCTSTDSDCCAAGYYSRSTAHIPCRACSRGRWSGPALHQRGKLCNACPAGMSTQVLAANRKSLCVLVRLVSSMCPPGSVTQSGPLGKQLCVICPPGRFSQDARMSQCLRCLPGRFTKTGAPSCNVCPRGKHADAHRISCKADVAPAGQPTTGPPKGGCKCAPAPRTVLRAHFGVACSSLGYILSKSRGGTFSCYQIPRAGCMCCGPVCKGG